MRLREVGAYEAKTHLGTLLDRVEAGEEIVITKRERAVARLVPAGRTAERKEVFSRIRALHARLALPRGETAKELIEAVRRL